MYGGCPPWGTWEPLAHHVRLDCTDTGDALWAQLGALQRDRPAQRRRDRRRGGLPPRGGARRRGARRRHRRAGRRPRCLAVAPGRRRGPVGRGRPTGPGPVHRDRGGPDHLKVQVRWTAPVRSAASATAASRAAADSASVRVRSGARKRSAKASDFFPVADLRAGVDVEQPDRLEQLAGSLAQGGLDLCRRHVRVDDERDVLLGHRVGREARGRTQMHGVLEQHVEVGLGARPSAAAAPNGRAHPRVQLAGVPDDARRPASSAAHRPGCQGAARGPRWSARDRAPAATTRTASTASAQPAARAAPHQPAGSASPAGTTPRCSGWSGQRLRAGRRARRRSGAVHRQDRAPAPSPAAASPAPPRRWPTPPRPAGVAAGRAQQPGSSVVVMRGACC